MGRLCLASAAAFRVLASINPFYGELSCGSFTHLLLLVVNSSERWGKVGTPRKSVWGSRKASLNVLA